MKIKRILSLALASALAISAMAQPAQRTANGLQVNAANGQLVEVQLYNDAIARIIKYPTSQPVAIDPSLAVVMQPEAVKFAFADGKDAASLRTGKMRISVDKATGAVTFSNAKGAVMLAEAGAAAMQPITKGVDKGLYTAEQGWALQPDEPIYGLGNLENGMISQRGIHRTLMPGNVEDGVTMWQSVKGYGIYWDNYSPTEAIDTLDVLTFSSPVAQAVDYYYMQGGSADGVIAELRTLTGQVPMFPLWTYGYWQCRERYKSQKEILEVATKYRQAGIPVDGMIQDWQYWGDNYLWNAMEFLNAEFPRAQEMIDSIHNMNAHIIVSIWSSFGPHTKVYHQMDSIGALFNISTWPESGVAGWPPRMDYPSGVKVYNPYDDRARDIYWQNLKRLHSMKIDGWWMDSTEPDHFNATEEDFDTPTPLGSFRKVRGAYPLLCVGGVHDHQKAEDQDKRVFILTRSGWVGQQRYGCNVWTGDVTSTWANLRAQLGAMLNFSLTGNPNTNSDLGGFFAGSYNKSWDDGGSAVNNPAYRELYVRWMQMGALTPMMRSHGTEVPREIYYYGAPGEPVYDALVDAIKLRYSLLPYIYSTAWDVTKNHGTYMRALPMDFPADTAVWNKCDAYMFGRQLLAAPVIYSQYTPEITKKVESDEDGWNKTDGDSRVTNLGNVDFTAPGKVEIYLPAGTDWWDFFTGERHAGGATITKATQLSTVPIFARAGAIVPIGPDVQYATEKPWDALTIKVFPGANGEFTLYEDEGDNYGYEQGLYTETPFAWADGSRTLTIGARKGQYPGMLTEREFRIVLPDGTERTAHYNGKPLKIKF